MTDSDAVKLRYIKLLHTLVWAVFAGAVFAIPIAGILGRFRWAFGLTVLVAVEVAVLVLNRMRCPLTDVAERYTDDRSDNFDIYLPVWLARYNKHIFGSWFIAGVLFVWWRYLKN
ncbi:MAG: hypothetical protein PVJ01_05380 [Pseudomonadota bacterium]|jgi:hypothetical protein